MSYGLFKSLLRQYSQVLMNDIFNQYQQDEERIGRGIPSLDRSHYCVLLSGGVAGEGKSYIPPIFLTAFSYENNIWSWQAVGAVPLQRPRMRFCTGAHSTRIVFEGAF